MNAKQRAIILAMPEEEVRRKTRALIELLRVNGYAENPLVRSIAMTDDAELRQVEQCPAPSDGETLP